MPGILGVPPSKYPVMHSTELFKCPGTSGMLSKRLPKIPGYLGYVGYGTVQIPGYAEYTGYATLINTRECRVYITQYPRVPGMPDATHQMLGNIRHAGYCSFEKLEYVSYAQVLHPARSDLT